MKTLDQVEPRTPLVEAAADSSAVVTSDPDYHFIILEAGSYYLTGNLMAAKDHGIEIRAADVTLDLGGFAVVGARSTGNGIGITDTSHRAAIRNGTVKNFAFGIRCLPSSPGAASANACAFRELAVSGCTDSGIVAGSGAVIDSCTAHNNGGTAGIFASNGSTISDCTATANSADYAIVATFGCSLSNCTASANTGVHGILAGSGSTLSHCAAYLNTSSASASAGISAGSGSTIIGCTSHSNTSTATPTPSTGMGFELGSGATIRDCTASENKGDGISLFADNHAVGNTCDGNGNSGDGAGIHAINSGNRIDGNQVSDNDRGIDVDAASNVIIRNGAGGNTTNYSVIGGNQLGPIGSATSATSPWANFSY